MPDKVSQCTPVSSTNTTDRHHITEILLKVALTTRNLIPHLETPYSFIIPPCC